MPDNNIIRIVLPNGKRRDFDLQSVLTTNDTYRCVSDILTFIKLHSSNRPDILWYPVQEDQVTDGIPNEHKPFKYS